MQQQSSSDSEDDNTHSCVSLAVYFHLVLLYNVGLDTKTKRYYMKLQNSPIL